MKISIRKIRWWFIVNRIFCIFIIVTIAGCATQPEKIVDVNINSIARPDAESKKTYILLPGDKNVTPDDLQFQEFAGYVRRGMATRGFNLSAQVDDADLVIYFSYGTGEPKTQTYSYSMPTYGQTGYSGSSTTGTVTPSYGGSANYSANTTYTPTYGITGNIPIVKSITTFPSWLILNAYDGGALRNDKKMEQVWKTTVVSVAEVGDLRRVMPLLVIGTFEYWGTNSGQAIHQQFDIDDPAILSFKGDKSK